MERKWFSKSSKKKPWHSLKVSQRKNAGKSSAFEIYQKKEGKVKTNSQGKQTMEMTIY